MTTTLNATETMAAKLIASAQRNGRWEAPIGWWGYQKGSLIGMVVQDLEWLRTHDGNTAGLLDRCIEGADAEDHPSWGEYVNDLAAALDR